MLDAEADTHFLELDADASTLILDADADIREERGRGTRWTWMEELCAVLAHEAANARHMGSQN